VYKKGKFIIKMYKSSGAVWYLDLSKIWLCPLDVSFSITDAEARAIAEEFLKRTGLRPKDSVFYKVSHSKVMVVSEGEKWEKITGATVIFRRQIDGIPVIGPGSVIRVYINHEKEVVGFYKLWREIEKTVGIAKIISLNSAIEKAKTRRSRADVARVDKLEFGYFAQGEADRQRYFQPAYLFCITVEIRGAKGGYVDVISGLANPLEAFER